MNRFRNIGSRLTGLGLMLTAGTAPRSEIKTKFRFVDLTVLRNLIVENCNSYCRCMTSAASFGRWDSADFMDSADKLIHENVEVKSLKISKIEYVSILGVYGPHFREKPGIAAVFCSLLGEAGVNILGISSSISTISCIIDVRDFEKAKSLLLTEFELT